MEVIMILLFAAVAIAGYLVALKAAWYFVIAGVIAAFCSDRFFPDHVGGAAAYYAALGGYIVGTVIGTAYYLIMFHHGAGASVRWLFTP